MMLLSAALNVVVVTAIIVIAARVLPRMCASRPAFGTALAVAVLAATALASALSHVFGASVAAALVAFLIPQGSQAFIASPDAGEQLADVGAFGVFALLVVPLAALAITRAFTLRRDVIARIAAAALAGEAAMTCVVVALMRPAWAKMMSRADAGGLEPMFDVVRVVGDAMGTIGVFAIVGTVAGVAFAVVAIGPALRARAVDERRALLIAACVAPVAAFILGGLASPSPDLLSQLLGTIMIGATWLVAVGLGLGARGVARPR
jgi:hypothetical protein